MSLKDCKKEQRAYLVTLSDVFENTESGMELLKCWKETYFFRTICLEDQPVESSKRDGENRFIRRIFVDLELFKQLQKENAHG